MQLSAFPLLFGISYDKNLSFEKNKTETSFIGEKGMKYQNLKPNHDDKITEIIINRGNLLEAVINLTNVDNNDSPENSLVKIISHSFIADIVLLISPPNKQKKSLILSGYDLISENYIYINEFEEVQISGLKKSFLSNSPIYINSYDPSLSTISKVINVEDLGNSVIIPINKEPLSPEFCILLAYPYTNQTINDFAVESIQKSRQEIINHSQQKTIAKKSELDKLELQSNEFEERASRFENENKLLLDEISSYQNVSNNNFNEELEMAKDTIEKLKVENEELSNNIEMVLLKEKERAEKDRKQKTEEVDSSPSISVFIKEAHNYIEELLNFYYSENIKNDGDGKQLSTNFSKSNSDELDDLLKSLYFISSVSSKDKEFNPDYFDLSEIVDKTINYFGEELRNKDITLRVDFHSELPKIYSDEEIIYEVVTNFLKNAVNACLYGGEILIKATIIQDQNSICLDIRDSGVGIEEKEIPLFFSISRSEKGISFSEDEKSELNLPVSKLLLEQLGGEVKIGSKIGKGTTFGLIIPISISQEKNNRTAK
ncbi:MAG: hypothetical protein HON98_06950 [Chloroflexi bacterium]|nr:hypothetical protein [Chloroflexota bacterium]MBT3669362.1 hypothetical protein [Chloroflexota bacterium]MBT4001814.1 hypothetical protein [Chloroflexota bacterium]MBT4534040.1 hypothetical protein [Chloroflexota bacterium]MBT4683258.1 hypothetical protein [Chloroflexota bacterium]